VRAFANVKLNMINIKAIVSLIWGEQKKAMGTLVRSLLVMLLASDEGL
jgi:hypothetical protein